MTETIKTMQLGGGDPSLDFVNTIDTRYGGPDLLQTYGDLLIWGERTELLAPREVLRLQMVAERDSAAAAAALNRAKAMREKLYQVFLSEVTCCAPTTEDFRRVSKVFARAMNSRQLCWDGGITWRWNDASDLDAVLHRVAFAAWSLLSESARRPIRRCGAENCGWLFLDTSRGGKRLWCSDASCGAKARVRRFREQISNHVAQSRPKRPGAKLRIKSGHS